MMTTTPAGKVGRPSQQPSPDAAREMARLLDGKPVSMRSLALVCGVSLATISRWVEAARQSMTPEEQWSPDSADDDLDPEDKVYLEKRYRGSNDPDVRAFVESIRTPLRRRP